MAKVFEPEGGHSVAAEAGVLVSELPFMVGLNVLRQSRRALAAFSSCGNPGDATSRVAPRWFVPTLPARVLLAELAAAASSCWIR